MTKFTASESALGLITQETMDRFPALTYSLGYQMAQEAGMDPNSPKAITTALQSQSAAGRLKQAADAQTRQDDRALSRLLGRTPSFDLSAEQGGYLPTMEEGARVATDVLQRNIMARNLVGKETLELTRDLASLMTLEDQLTRDEKKAKSKAFEKIDQKLLEARNQALAARAITRSQLTNMSPADRNAVLAAQASFFQTRINNLEALRTAREGAIDDAFDTEREETDRKIRTTEQRIEGYDKAIELMEQSGADATSIADIRIKLAQEREKLRKERQEGTFTKEDLILNHLIKLFQRTHEDRSPNAQEKDLLKTQAKQIAADPKLMEVILGGEGPGQVNIASALEFSGFGLPISRKELADLRIQQEKLPPGALEEEEEEKGPAWWQAKPIK